MEVKAYGIAAAKVSCVGAAAHGRFVISIETDNDTIDLHASAEGLLLLDEAVREHAIRAAVIADKMSEGVAHGT